MYVHVSTHVCVYVGICMYLCIYAYVPMCICAHVHMCMCVHICRCYELEETRETNCGRLCLPHSTAPLAILELRNARVGRNRYHNWSHYFNTAEFHLHARSMSSTDVSMVCAVYHSQGSRQSRKPCVNPCLFTRRSIATSLFTRGEGSQVNLTSRLVDRRFRPSGYLPVFYVWEGPAIAPTPTLHLAIHPPKSLTGCGSSRTGRAQASYVESRECKHGSQSNDLSNLYLSLPSLALGITRIAQGHVSTVSG